MKHYLIPSILIFLSACSDWASEREVQRAMRVYDKLVINMDADSLAGTYLAEGRLDTINGREAIRKFLKSFTDVRVLDCRSKSTSVKVNDDVVDQTGTYTEKVVVKTDTLNLSGKFATRWKRIGGKWYIEAMSTTPD